MEPLAKPPHSIPAPDSAPRGRRPFKSEGHSTPHDPLPRVPAPVAAPSPILPLSSQNWGKRRGKHRQGRGTQPVGQRLAMRRRTRPNAPPFALCGCAQVCASLRHKVRGWGAYWGGTGKCHGRLGVRKVALPSRPTLAPCKVFRPEEPRTPIPTLSSGLPRPRLSRRWGLYTPRRAGTERLAGGGGAGLRRGSARFTNHISVLCAGSQQPVA